MPVWKSDAWKSDAWYGTAWADPAVSPGTAWFKTAWVAGAWGNAAWADVDVSYDKSPGTGTVTFTGNVPTVALPATVSASTGTVTFTGNIPVVAALAPISPTTGVITFTGNRPVIDYSSLDQATYHENPVAWQQDYGHAARFAFYRLGVEVSKRDSSATFEYQPTTGDVTFTGNVPTLQIQTIARPATGDLEFTGNRPAIGYSPSVTPSTGVITLTGNVPQVNTEVLVTAGTGEITFTGNAPALIYGPTVLAGTGEITFTGNLPVVDKQETTIDTVGTGEIYFVGGIPVVSGYIRARSEDGGGKGKKPSKRRRKPVIVEIDGQEFSVSSEAEAVQLIETATEAAREAAKAQAEEIIRKREKKSRKSRLNTSPIRLAEPQISVRPANDGKIDQEWLRSVQSAADNILEAYQSIAKQYETMLLMQYQAQLDDEDALVALLLTL